MKQYIKPSIIAIAILVALYAISVFITREPKMLVEYKQAIDSINKINSKLIEKQKSLDSLINVYQKEVELIDTKISNIKEKTTVIKEYYHEISQQTTHYNADQIDSFFKSKYEY